MPVFEQIALSGENRDGAWMKEPKRLECIELQR